MKFNEKDFFKYMNKTFGIININNPLFSVTNNYFSFVSIYKYYNMGFVEITSHDEHEMFFILTDSGKEIVKLVLTYRNLNY